MFVGEINFFNSLSSYLKNKNYDLHKKFEFKEPYLSRFDSLSKKISLSFGLTINPLNKKETEKKSICFINGQKQEKNFSEKFISEKIPRPTRKASKKIVSKITDFIHYFTNITFQFLPVHAKEKDENMCIAVENSLSEKKKIQSIYFLVVKAIRENDLRLLRVMVKETPQKELKDALKMQDSKGNTPFHLAIEMNQGTKWIKFMMQTFPNEFKDAFIVCNQAGETLLHLILEKNHFVILKFIAKAFPNELHISLNMEDKDGWSPFHWSVKGHHLKTMKFIAKRFPKEFKNVLEKKDQDGWNLVHFAGIWNSWENIQWMAQFAPKEFKCALKSQNKKGFTPLHLVAKEGNIEVLKFFIEKNLDALAILNHEGDSILSLLKQLRPKNYRQVTQFFKNHLLLKETHRSLLNRKALSHAWHIPGKTSLIKTNTKKVMATLSLAGHHSPEWFHLMDKKFNSFNLAYPNVLDITQKKLFKQLVDLGANSASYSVEDKWKRIQAGLPTIINSGYLGHEVTLLIWGDQFVICNRSRSQRRKTPIKIYHFNPKHLDLIHLIEIEKVSNSGTFQNYKALFFDSLYKKLNFSQTKLDCQMEKENPLPFQTMGNCSFLGPVTAMYAFLLIGNFRGMTDQGCLKECSNLRKDNTKQKRRAIFSYQTWLSHLQISILEDNIKALKKQNLLFEPDHPLITASLRKAHLLPLDNYSQKKLQTLTTSYLKSLDQKNRTALKADIVYWKSLKREPLL